MFSSLKVIVGRHESSVSANELLKNATAANSADDFDGAINLLRQAYSEIARGPVSYSVDTFLRLPLYLQQAGRDEEAWHEFNLLLTRGFPNQLNHADVIPMEHSRIYDKMRLCLQREKQFDRAVRFGVLSFVSWAIGLDRQRRGKELAGYIDVENIEDNIRPLLVKAKKPHLKEELISLVIAETKHLRHVNLIDLGNSVDAVVMR
ncbi:MAG TPA: hypothetical protein VJT71_12585 [Pyrinomonadaceae bacterium]|nr:hypothetical protein [Pyrinomonadaceae bacterium]